MQDKELSQYDRDNELKTSEPAGKRKEEKHECNISSIRYNTTYNNR